MLRIDRKNTKQNQYNKYGGSNLVRTWLFISLGWFICAGLLGLLMRYLFVDIISGVNLKFILHTHSHIALLGWLYSALYVGILTAFLPEKVSDYKINFYLTQITILGMLISFPFQGYAFYSISFSTLFLFASYWFAWKVSQDIKGKGVGHVSFSFLRSSLFYLCVSSLGPWALGPLVVLNQVGTPLYQNTIYFYLHFLYNGFIVMAIMALIYRYIESFGLSDRLASKRTFRLLQYSIVPSYALSVIWMRVHWSIYLIGVLSAGGLLFSLVSFWTEIRLVRTHFRKKNAWANRLLKLVFYSYCLKIMMQVFSAAPMLSRTVHSLSKFFVIVYLHLVFLGFASLFIIAYSIVRGFLQADTKLSVAGLVSIISGVLITESVLFYQGTMYFYGIAGVGNFGIIMLGGSMLIPAGVGLFLAAQFMTRETAK